MRILHTSDWHLGRSFGPHALLDDQVAFLAWLVDVVRDESIDLVVIAGDIYDRAIAPTEAITAFRDTLVQLREAGSRVVAITGNHDGADRVAAYDSLVDASGIHLRGGYHRPGDVLTLSFDDGPLDIVALPFLDPQLAPPGFDHHELRSRTHHSVLARAVELARDRLRAPRSLAVAHAFVAGGATSESERQLTVGGAGHVDAALFSGFSYAALGHLHRPQVVGVDHVRYAGSPLPYSFSETQPKSVTLVDLDARGGASIRTVQVPLQRGVATVTGTIDELCSARPDPAVAGSFVRAVLTDLGVVLDAKARLAEVYPHVVEVELRPAGVPTTVGARPLQVADVDPLDVTRSFWADVNGTEPTDAELDLLRRALHHAHAEGLETAGGRT